MVAADGAALVLIGDREAGDRAGLAPRARIVASTEAADDPVLQLTAGCAAIEQVMSTTGAALRDFAPDPDKVTVNDGHLAMDHPMGATSAF